MPTDITAVLDDIAGGIRLHGSIGFVYVDSSPRGLPTAIAREALGLAIVDGRVRISRVASALLAVGDYYDGNHNLRFT